MLFNRYAVEREDSFVLLHFGFVNKAGTLVDTYSTAISELEVEHLRRTMMEYLGRQGTLLEPPPMWHAAASTRIDLSNHIVMAHHGKVAETVLYSFSHWSALEEARKRAVAQSAKKGQEMQLGVMAEGMALLRSPLNVQQHLIRLLFPATESLLPSE
jgi:hypothetical protein